MKELVSFRRVTTINKGTPIQIYKKKNEFMSEHFTEVTATEIYSDIFPLESIEKKGDKSQRASNPIFSYRSIKDCRAFFRNEIVFADCFEDSIEKTQKNDLALCSMISYSGRSKSAKNGYKCHGFIIDLDGVGMRELECFWGWVEHLEKIPYPTYVANSGHGLHIYYLFQNPVPLYPQVVEHLQKLKRGLTRWIWNKETSTYRPEAGKIYDTCRQYQGIYQSFRMVGSRTKLGKGNARNKYLVRAWKTGKPVSISYLNEFVDDEYKCPENPDYSSWDYVDEEHHSLEECRKLYPDWYLKRIINKEPSGQWKCNRGLYEWWLRKIQEQGNSHDGNRYHCISMLYVFAIKCMLDKSIVDEDAMELLQPFNELTIREDNDFTEEDIKAASKFYDTKFVKFSRKEIIRRTGIFIKECKRNGRKQSQHLAGARAIQEISDKFNYTNWRNGNGRKPKKDIVLSWRKSHPNGKKIDCIRDTGLTKPTVYKWWNEKKDQDN